MRCMRNRQRLLQVELAAPQRNIQDLEEKRISNPKVSQQAVITFRTGLVNDRRNLEINDLEPASSSRTHKSRSSP